MITSRILGKPGKSAPVDLSDLADPTDQSGLGKVYQLKPPGQRSRGSLPACSTTDLKSKISNLKSQKAPKVYGLSAKEIQCICTAAGKAYKLQVENYQVDPHEENASQWRHRIMLEQWGVKSLKDLDHNKLFNAMVAHFNSYTVAGIDRAFRHAMRGDDDSNRQRIALFKIKHLCDASGGQMPWPAYPLKIARDQFKVRELEDLSPKAAWALFYTMTNRGRSKEAKSNPRRTF